MFGKLHLIANWRWATLGCWSCHSRITITKQLCTRLKVCPHEGLVQHNHRHRHLAADKYSSQCRWWNTGRYSMICGCAKYYGRPLSRMDTIWLASQVSNCFTCLFPCISNLSFEADRDFTVDQWVYLSCLSSPRNFITSISIPNIFSIQYRIVILSAWMTLWVSWKKKKKTSKLQGCRYLTHLRGQIKVMWRSTYLKSALPPSVLRWEDRLPWCCFCLLSGFLLTFKVVFVWFDRGMLEFQSKIACQCPHWLRRLLWDTVQQMTADHGGQQGAPAVSLPAPSPVWQQAEQHRGHIQQVILLSEEAQRMKIKVCVLPGGRVGGARWLGRAKTSKHAV